MKRLVSLAVLLLLFPLLSVAQDAQATFTAQDLYNWSTDLYFPQAIDFTLSVRRSESTIASLSLTVSYRNADPTVIEIDPALIDAGVARYRWDIPTDNPPPLFSRVRYTWDILTTNGQPYTITDDLDFTDHRVNWVQSNDVQGQINFYHAQNRLDPLVVREGIRSAYDLLFADSSNKPLYTLLVYPANVPIGCALDEEDEPILRVRGAEGLEDIPCNQTLANRIYDRSEFIVFNQTSVDEIQQTIIDLLVEAYYVDQWDEAIVPAWFLRGLQQFYDPRLKVTALTLTQQKSRSDDLLSLDELATMPTDAETMELWDAQSIALILYLADTVGVDGLFEFADSIADYDSFADAYEDSIGQSLDVLLITWQDWLFRSSSQLDFEYNPYLPDTPTPTATATATNTPTATFTPSLTPHVTITPSPTITPVPPTPTITPLPAQSFAVQPTAIPPTPIPPEELEQSAPDEGLVTRAAIGGAVILGLLMLLYIVLKR